MSAFPIVTYITDTAQIPIEEIWDRATRSLDGVAIIVRDKQLSLEARMTLAMEIRAWDAALAAPPTVLFSVPTLGDLAPSLEWASELGIDGLHFASAAWSREAAALARVRLLRDPGRGRPPWISVACHSPAEAGARADQGANVLVLSPIFESPGKGLPLGLHALREARAAIAPDCTLVALGGVDASNASACLHAGAHGVAAIRNELVLVADA